MLITCGNCGNDISDKAMKCPKCKTPVKPLAISCPECSKDIDASALESECPHCGYPLRHLRLSGASSSPSAPAKPEPKAKASLECPNCGLAMRQDFAGEGPECPNCGYGMRPEKADAGTQGKSSRGALRQAPDVKPPKEPPEPKTRIRMAMESLGIMLIVCAVSFGALFLALRYDFLGMRTTLKTAAFSEETSESINGGLSDVRLWAKHVLSVVLDQLPDDAPQGSGHSVEGERR